MSGEVACSLQETLAVSARRHADREAVADRWGSVTYEGLSSRVGRLASLLRLRGLREGRAALVVLPNSRLFPIAHFAVLSAGGISVPLDFRSSAAEVGYVAGQVDPDLLITDAETLPTLSGIAAEWKMSVLSIGSARDLATLDAELSGIGSRTISARQKQDLATILFTTGSTGRAKGVPLTHANILFTISNLRSFLRYSSDDREVIVLPATHSFGLGHIYSNLFSGGAVYLENGLVPFKRVLSALKGWRATGFPGTPLGFAMLMDNFRQQFAEAASGLRFIVVNSAPMPPARTGQLQDILPNVEIFAYYGLTEASRTTIISLSRGGERLYDSVGRPMSGVTVGLDPATNEILVSGPNVVSSYWKDEVASADAFQDGWLRTGDIGRLDAEGNLFVTGRIKDQINIGGYKIDPTEVENFIRSTAEVADVAVCGIQDNASETEQVVAVLVSKEGRAIDTGVIERACAASLAAYKVPTKWVTLPAIPRAQTGKLLREDLQRLIRAYRSPEDGAHD